MKKHEKLLYQENSISYQLMLMYILGNTAYILIYVNKMDVDYQLGFFVILNIFISLLSFLIAVRQKLYVLQWGYVGIAVAAFQFIRLLWIPEEIVNPFRLLLSTLLIATGTFALAGSILCVERSLAREKFIVENQIDLATLQR